MTQVPGNNSNASVEETEGEKKARFATAIQTIIELSGEMQSETDPFAHISGPAPLEGAIIDVSNHPAVVRANESLDAAEAEIGIVNAITAIGLRIASKFGVTLAL